MEQIKSLITGGRAWRLGSALLLAGLAGGLAGQHSRARGVTASAPITEVSVRHTACYGPCPVYTVTLRRNGTASYVGVSSVEKIGTYTGRFYNFDRLARAIGRRGFGRFKAAYTMPATDLPHTVTTVVQGGRRKTVDNYADVGPQELWEVQTLIDGAVAEADWHRVGPSAKR